MHIKKTLITMISAIALAGSMPITAFAARETSTIQFTPMYQYVMNLTAKANTTTTYQFKCDDDWYTAGGPASLLRTEGVSGSIYRSDDKDNKIYLGDSNDNMVALTKGKFYFIDLENTTENDVNIDILFERDEIVRGALRPRVIEPDFNAYTYKITKDTEEATETGVTCEVSTLLGGSSMKENYSYTFDLTEATEDYIITSFNVSYSSYAGTMQWVGQGSKQTHNYDYRIPATTAWSDGRQVSAGTLEHGKTYTFSINYTYPEDEDFWYLISQQESGFWNYKDPVVTWKLQKASIVAGDDKSKEEKTTEEKKEETKKEESKKDKNKKTESSQTTATIKIGTTELTYRLEGKNATVIKGSGINVKIPSKVNIAGKNYKVTAIADSAFAKNKTLESIEVGGNITEIPKNCFKNCANLSSAKLGKKVSVIKTGAFDGCKSFTNLTTMGKVKKVEKNSFRKTGKKITYTAKNITKKQANATAKAIKKTGKAKKVEVKKK